MKKVVIIILGVILLSVIIGGGATFIINKINYANRKIDDSTNYETIKMVENTCRSMIASYKTDLNVYQQYKDSEDKEKQSWAEQAKMRANKTANSYNEYILKNSFIWSGNIPSDIDSQLPIIY